MNRVAYQHVLAIEMSPDAPPCIDSWFSVECQVPKDDTTHWRKMRWRERLVRLMGRLVEEVKQL